MSKNKTNPGQRTNADRGNPKDTENYNMDPRLKAKSLLRHYLRTCFVRQQIIWNEDNDTEAGEIVDLIVEAVRQEIMDELKAAITQVG